MASITFLAGSTVDARTRLLEEELRLKNTDPMNCLHIVPTRTMVMEMENRGLGSMNRQIDTLSSLIGRIFYDDIYYRLFREFSFMDDAMRELATQLILERRNATPEGLRYFFPLFSSSAKPDTLKGIYRHILEFFSLLVSNNFEDDLVEVLSRKIIRSDEEIPGTGEKRFALDTDLALLFGDYEEFKKSHRLYDNDDILSSVRAFLTEANPPSVLKDIDILIFNSFISITKAEEVILLSLFAQVGEVIWSLDYDPGSDESMAALIQGANQRENESTGLYEAYRIYASLGSLLRKTNEAEYPTTIKRSPKEPFNNPFASGLYRSGRYDEQGESAIHIKAFNTRLDEIKGIASEIKRTAIERKREDLTGMRVIFPDLSQYSSLIYELFPAYGIPFNITKGLPLFSSPLAGLFLLLLDIPRNGFQREDIHAFFTSGLVSPATPSMDIDDQERWLTILEGQGAFFAGEKPRPGEVFSDIPSATGEKTYSWIERVSVVAKRCGIHGGAIAPEWIIRARDYFSSHYHMLGRDKKASLLRDYYRFLHHLFYVYENVRPFEELPKLKTPSAMVRELFHLLTIFGIQENILLFLGSDPDPKREQAEKSIRRDTSALRTLKELAVKTAKELDREELFLPESRTTSLIERFRKGFADSISKSSVKETYQKGAVDISEWSDIIGCSFDDIFAGGLCSNEFPLTEPDDFILPESSGPHLRKTDLTDQSRYLFTHLLRNYRHNLYISYPKTVGEKETQPSPVLLDMVSMMERKDVSPSQGIEAMEDSFRWEKNPSFTASDEFLDSIEVEQKLGLPSKENLFFHKHIILGTDSLLNQSIIRAVGCLLSRSRTDGLSEYDGLVSGSPAFLRYRSGLRQVFSASRLDLIANCPMRYLFQTLYELEPIEELKQELSFKDLGSHIHALLKLLFEEIVKHGRNVASLGLSRAAPMARDIAAQYFSHLGYLERLDWFEVQKRDIIDGLDVATGRADEELPSRQGLLAHLLRFESQHLGDEQIVDLEHRFGNEDAIPVSLGRTQVQGYIDRIDKMDDQEVYFIYDYKTGKAPGPGAVKRGLSFQLPGYIAALAAERGGTKPIAAAYYSINRKELAENSPFSSPLGYNFPYKTGIDLTGTTLIQDYVNKLIDLLDRGIFHHSTDELMCSFCEFKYACYKDKRRMAHLVDSKACPEIYSGKKNLEKWKEMEGFQKRWKEIQKKMAEPRESKKGEKKSKDLEQVLEFKQWLLDNQGSLPLERNYIDKILTSIRDYQHSFFPQQ
ncbi:MAG: PD-(D/E)XK nuclease family protein [Thermodesulfobacteriota bacterium]